MSFDYLREGSKFCFYQLLGEHWNITEARHYLNILGANKEVQNKILEKCKTARKHHTEINDRNVLIDSELPAYWLNKSISIDHCVDALMHLLFEGVFKSILKLSGEWLAEQNCRSKFLNCINNFIKKVSSLNLSY